MMRTAVWLLPVIVPPVVWWARHAERRILRHGVPLADPHLADAAQMGVAHPERIRLLHVDTILLPASPILRLLARGCGLYFPSTAGLTLRYGILIRADCRGDRRLIAHECVHTAQYERLGGLNPFLRRYLHECLALGYPASPLEQEANCRSSAIPG